eukprot:TRINITY_DN15339_c0_g1_i1.p1 TRINITY_DN15339_c0_g1~~TRINITY_DN15339_c0_g1_i1.p1  ORF type:complete len:590 (-),score=92.66 TRINITY_DN15339_c0_g1_i1:125-1726(-)
MTGDSGWELSSPGSEGHCLSASFLNQLRLEEERTAELREERFSSEEGLVLGDLSPHSSEDSVADPLQSPATEGDECLTPRRGRMNQLGRWGKKNRDWAPGKTAVHNVVTTLRSRNLERSTVELDAGHIQAELAAMMVPPSPPSVARVLCIRHGMGHHNDLGGALSLFNRDATLNEVGCRQAFLVGSRLQSAGVLGVLDLVVVSPFTRALETAARVVGEAGRHIPTLVQPLCAEHTLARSQMQQGDRGSTAQELRKSFPPSEFPQYDFSPLEDYCASRSLDDGKWWLHSAGKWRESPSSFARRAEAFRVWLGETCALRGATRVLLVSHGGLLSQAFGGPVFDYVECRAIDVAENGTFSRAVDHSEDSVTPPSQGREDSKPLSSEGSAYCTSPRGSSDTRDDLMGDNVWIDGEESCAKAVFYSVRVGASPPVPRRYSEFLALKAQLKRAGKDRFSKLFPGKLHVGGSVVGRRRKEMLQAWLVHVVAAHGTDNFIVASFLARSSTSQCPSPLPGSEGGAPSSFTCTNSPADDGLAL